MSDSPHPERAPDWTLDEALAATSPLEVIVRDLYDRLFDDLMVGFLFTPHDKAQLVAHQVDYLRAHLGRRDPAHSYQGRSMREAHEHVPILPGHFDRRHELLRQVLAAHRVPEHVTQAWLHLDQSLRPLIVRQGAGARAAALSSAVSS